MSRLPPASGEGGQAAVQVLATAAPTAFQSSRLRTMSAEALDAARQRLQSLPLDRLPEPADLPAGSRVPFKVGRHFAGRADELRALAGLLKSDQIAVIVPADEADPAGVGKSGFAAEFTRRYGHYFAGGVFWVNCASAAAVPLEIAACADPVQDAHLATLDPAERIAAQLRAVLERWQSPVPRLLIFEDCDDEQILDRWAPPAGGSQVLVIGRQGRWSAARLALGTLTAAEGTALLHLHRPELLVDDPDLASLAAELAYLPQALALAGRFLAAYRDFVTPAAYLAMLRRDDHLAQRPLSGAVHVRAVARSFALSYERLAGPDALPVLARALLARAACLAPGSPFPRAWLPAALELDVGDVQAPFQVVDALNRLLDLGLLESASDSTLTMPRLVTACALHTVRDPAARHAVERLLLHEAGRARATGDPTSLAMILVHLQAMVDQVPLREDEATAALCAELGSLLGLLGLSAQARLYLERALAIREGVLGPSHPATAGSLADLALLSRNLGDLGTARSLYEQALAIREETQGADAAETARSLGDLAMSLQEQGEYFSARDAFERMLAITERAFGPDSPTTALALNNLGLLQQLLGEYPEARHLFERALSIHERALGADHADTAATLNNLAYLRYVQGDFAGVRPLLEHLLVLNDRVLGPDHPMTALNLNNLALLLKDRKEYGAARPLFERALSINERVLGPDHLDTATSLNNLATLVLEQGDGAAAQQLFERALAILQRTMGAEHPSTAAVQANLARVHADLQGGRQPGLAAMTRARKVGRNEPCPCGSGKKYKRCCGAG